MIKMKRLKITINTCHTKFTIKLYFYKLMLGLNACSKYDRCVWGSMLFGIYLGCLESSLKRKKIMPGCQAFISLTQRKRKAVFILFNNVQ